MAGRHLDSSSNERNTALFILVIGAVAALASAVGPIWVVRGGVVVALVMAAISLVVAFKQIDRIRAEHQMQLREEVEKRKALTDKHHASSVAMIERFNARAANLADVIVKLRTQLASAKSELSSMRGNAAWLRAEVAQRQARIEELAARIAELEASLACKDAEDLIVELPMHAEFPQAEDLWDEDEHPTMIDIRKLRMEDPTPIQGALRQQA